MKKRNKDQLKPPPWEQLRSWVALVDAGSVSAAARHLGISQAGVSQHVRQLEDAFCTALLDRSTRPAHPTVAGQRLYEQASLLLKKAGQMDEVVRAISRSRRAMLRVGCVDSFAAAIGPDVVRGLGSKAQRLSLVSGINPGLAQQFTDHQLDFLITTDAPTDSPGRIFVPLFSEKFLLALPSNLAISNGLSISEVGEIRPFMHYSTRGRIGTLIEVFLSRHDPNIPKVFEFDATDPLLSLVREDIGFTLTTPLCLWQSRFNSERVQLKTLESLRTRGQPYPDLIRTFYLVHRPDELSSLVNDLIQLVRIAIKDLKRQMTATLPTAADLLMLDSTE